ncbi:hypothetical protein [Ottowia sp.]|jgi:hypothetical protein|uniref:hypothetical protein n=1 Tax=Ottowia sp. TaxID=1898956 RepID=UPI002C46AF07|nr:hypothetical protein [Ottowia sp.]HNR82654.1 hypothetical protein [Ottowia sp.]
MRKQLLDTSLAQTMAWIWLGFLVAGLVTWIVYRYWRQRHPPAPPPPELSYSQRLEQRLAKRRGAAKRKRRGRSAKS